MSAPLVFLDTETDGLRPSRKVWEVAMIRRDDQGQREISIFVALDLHDADPFALRVGRFWDRHPAGRKISGKGNNPADVAPIYSLHDMAKLVMEWTFGAHIVGAVPSFDTETLSRVLHREGYVPSWHHHLIDVETMAVGWLRAKAKGHDHAIGLNGQTMSLAPPWKSDELAGWCGVEPASDADRHTALGDARWAMRWYDAMTGVES